MFVDFQKTFFPTEEEIKKRQDSFERYYNRIKEEYMKQGMSESQLEKQIYEDIKDFVNKGYFE
ncbi:hypothetical protein WKH57_01215 [Niallia taxi]|uniref:hypothetical protein n=1 Tax=Niallia taxi TaxID=2499688 RepID=UPI00317281C3